MLTETSAQWSPLHRFSHCVLNEGEWMIYHECGSGNKVIIRGGGHDVI